MGADSREAHDGTRTRDLFLTKEVLCRLSYVSTALPTEPSLEARGRNRRDHIKIPCSPLPTDAPTGPSARHLRWSTAGGNRTPNRRFWRPVLYQLSYCRTRLHGQGGNRTPDTTIFSRVLYQLSYLAASPCDARCRAVDHRREAPP
jgi:hypothetical protein